ncbi:MAG: hypothetical protein PHI24_14665 [Desulfitobacteriaceae bacterium]|nr:hypothetical protein [Desulfitobacteriaceae bacterium]
MRLIGSKQEQEFRNELLMSHKALFEDDSGNRLLRVLKMHFKGFKTAYIINWIPEQGEDLYTVLIDTDMIAKVEVSRITHNNEPIVETFKLKEFQKGLSKLSQIKLAVAVDLAQKNMK